MVVIFDEDEEGDDERLRKDGGGSFGKVKEKEDALVELLELWWFPWRWRRKKMKVRSWRSCSGGCCGGDEEGVGEG